MRTPAVAAASPAGRWGTPTDAARLREALTDAGRDALGDDAGRFPLFD